MKTINKFLSAAALIAAGPLTAMDVHEWGTFTTFAGSSGAPLAWYQPASDQAKLPKFVSRNLMATKAAIAVVRMETPVIYFYPEKTTSVTVEAAFHQGNITESYPRPNLTKSGATRWTGTLRPPDDADAIAAIPAITGDHPDEPYAAARAVPDAWIFQSTLVPQAEKFIFYRGSGHAAPTISASIDEADRITLTNSGPHDYPVNIALRVENGKAHWQQLPHLPQRQADQHQSTSISATFAGEERDKSTVESELVSHFQQVLEDQGLTADEAAAMVATWRGTWFREDGMRVFTILPRPWIDEILPLKIDPVPTTLTRVFIARLEILPPAKESTLISLLNADSADTPAVQNAFRDLRLGRFAHGAMQRSINLEQSRLRARFHHLQQTSNPALPEQVFNPFHAALPPIPTN